jgi:hypothetical protein
MGRLALSRGYGRTLGVVEVLGGFLHVVSVQSKYYFSGKKMWG